MKADIYKVIDLDDINNNINDIIDYLVINHSSILEELAEYDYTEEAEYQCGNDLFFTIVKENDDNTLNDYTIIRFELYSQAVDFVRTKVVEVYINKACDFKDLSVKNIKDINIYCL